MMATKGAIGFEESAYSLPYAAGLQIIWAARVGEGGVIRAALPDKGVGATQKVRDLIG